MGIHVKDSDAGIPAVTAVPAVSYFDHRMHAGVGRLVADPVYYGCTRWVGE